MIFKYNFKLISTLFNLKIVLVRQLVQRKHVTTIHISLKQYSTVAFYQPNIDKLHEHVT